MRAYLAAIDDPRLVVETIADAAGAGSSPGSSALDAAIATLRDRRALLVLDNFEHVARAAPTSAPCSTPAAGSRRS